MQQRDEHRQHEAEDGCVLLTERAPRGHVGYLASQWGKKKKKKRSFQTTVK